MSTYWRLKLRSAIVLLKSCNPQEYQVLSCFISQDSASAPKESKPAGGKHGRPDAASSDVPQKADKGL